MKITKKYLQKLIKEETKSMLTEEEPSVEAINAKLAIGMKAIQEAMAMLQAIQGAPAAEKTPYTGDARFDPDLHN